MGSVRRIVKFPESKCNLLFEEAIKFYHIHTQTVLQFLHLLRLIVKTLEIVQHTRLYFRPIQLYMFWQSESQLQWITTKPFPQHLNFRTICCGGYRKLISERDFIGKKNCPSGTLTTDGSLDGWGAYLWSNVIQGKWDQLQERYRINLLELLAVWNVLKHLSHDKGVSCNNSDRQQNSSELNHETRGTPFTNTVYLDLKKMWTW